MCLDSIAVALLVIAAKPYDLLVTIELEVVLVNIRSVGVEERTCCECEKAGLHSKYSTLGDTSYPLLAVAWLDVYPVVWKSVVCFLDELKSVVEGLLCGCSREVDVVCHLVRLSYDRNAAPTVEHTHIAVGHKAVRFSFHIFLHLCAELRDLVDVGDHEPANSDHFPVLVVVCRESLVTVCRCRVRAVYHEVVACVPAVTAADLARETCEGTVVDLPAFRQTVAQCSVISSPEHSFRILSV